ncbi:calponin homology domain-containing protein DDB_G0272472 isoform X2 [Xiphias gladius]|nr:calponin homology domain-containing protein DDB_G0272472 isoform X2 [Xiphias gladius]XP_040011119.1 calponin homology domain-containing protein DDB_G0272472 isoform X2 [Xiphias gladius]XP_040011120.1 calponin homology domain-containing protein DDB_G0272472 isoform X2 [Xiphias gladius]XP_040011121.1 calponin homology domain-containing protein DDB_G0272472 isoform X2 [Xiphias gladius]XP_040011122.1 calponin homology domain-containing protein DDB_G0272472 isoform X2 [Xiphias gladius]XP_0400111
MAAQVEVQTGEVGRTAAGGRLHLNPLTDSSNKSLIEIPSINQSHIITPEPNKPVPGPKPRLTPKPFAVDKNPTIKPILAPKPQTKPRPESTRLAGYKPELLCSPKPQQAVATVKPRPVSTNPNRPAPTSFKTSTMLNTGQTTKPVVQPFKPAPPLEPEDPSKSSPPVLAERQKPGASSLGYSKSLRKLPAAEWSGTTKNEDEKDNMTANEGEVSITRAKSMGFLVQVGQDEEEKEKAKPEPAVPLRPKPRGSRPRPLSAIFLDSPTKTEAPVAAPRWAGRRPLSADLTSKFESIGLSLHRKSPKANTKENTPEETALPQKREQEKTPKSTTPQNTDVVAKPAISEQSNQKTEEMTVKEIDEDKRRVSIKSRISLLLDLSSTPGTGATVQGSDLNSPVQLVPQNEPPVGVKQLIKQLTEDTTPTQSPIMKPALKPRPLPLDLTKRFSSKRSPDLGSVSLSETTDHHEISKDPQMRNEELALTPSDHRTFVDLKDSQEQLQNTPTPEGPEAGQTFGATSSGPSSEVQTVRASLFENVVERHSVLMVDEGKPVNKPKDSLSSPSFKRGNSEDEGTLVTATYKEPVSPSSPLRVLHAFDTVQAIEEKRAVSENVPSAQWEDKAMTLRSRHSEGSRPVAERTGSAQAEPAMVGTPEQQPRYLRVGALQKWTTTGLNQDAGMEEGMLKESQREGQVAMDKDRLRVAEQEEVAAAPKRLKMLQPEEQQRARATYFALTGQIQEPVSPVDAGANIGDMAVPFDFSVRSALGGSQGMILPVRRNPSLDDAFGKTSQDQVEELMMRRDMSYKEIRSASDGQTTEEMMEVEKKKELTKETEKHKAKMKDFEREKQRQLEIQKQAHLEFARMKERELQREFERQRQKAFEKEKQEFEKKQRALERQKQIELEKQKLQELEREKQREMERERQRQLEKEKRRELERQRENEMEKLREQERERQCEQERQRQREEERQRELNKERQLLEIQKEKRKMEELERIKELERQQLLQFQKQKQEEKERQQVIELEKQRLREKMEREEAEKIKLMALEQEMLRLKELDKERERQKEMEKERRKEMEREKQRELERQRQLDIERQELENQRLRQRELEKERQRKEELERLKEMERRLLLEFEKQKQAERDRQLILELEKRRLREKMEREEAEKMRQIAKQQEAERQRLKEKLKKEEQERARLESSPLRPKVVDLDSVLRNDPFSKAPSQRSDPATRWKEPSPRTEESYKPAILDIDTFTSQIQLSPSKDFFPVSSIQGVDAGFGSRLQPTPERDVSWKVPPQTLVGFSSPVWTTSPQDPWELQPVEMSVDKPVAESRKHSNKLNPEQLLLRQEEQLLAPQRHWSALLDEPLHLVPFPGTDTKTSSSPGGVYSSPPAEQVWYPREPQPQDIRAEVWSHRRSEGSQELNRMRSRSVSRRSAPSSSAVEGSLSRMRSRSAHRERDHHSWVQQKQSISGEEEGNDSETPVHETDSQYGTWETGLRTTDSLTPATPSSESNLSPSPTERKPTPLHTPGDGASQFEIDILDGLLPPSSSDSQPLSFPDAPTTLLDTSALRSRAQLGKKRAPRTRPTRAARQSAALAEAEGEGGTTEDWLYRDSTEAKVENKGDDSDSEEQARGADAPPAVASQPQRIALFPGMDPSALKAQLKKRGDSDNQTDGPTPSPSQLSRSPKSPFLPRAARVLPPPGGKENGEEGSPQWLKELKSKKRLSQYENEC